MRLWRADRYRALKLIATNTSAPSRCAPLPGSNSRNGWLRTAWRSTGPCIPMVRTRQRNQKRSATISECGAAASTRHGDIGHVEEQPDRRLAALINSTAPRFKEWPVHAQAGSESSTIRYRCRADASSSRWPPMRVNRRVMVSGSVIGTLRQINAGGTSTDSLAQSISRATRRGAVQVFARGPCTLIRASPPFRSQQERL
jgi:hypothetical protein